MSWKCPGNVLEMSLGWGHVLGMGTCPKTPGTELDGWPFFLQNFLSHMPAVCPWIQSCVLSCPWNKKLANQQNLPNLSLEDKFNSSVYIFLPKFFFWIYKTNINSKMKK